MSERGAELTYHHDGQGLTERCRVVVADDPHPVNGDHYAYYTYGLLLDLMPVMHHLREALAVRGVLGQNVR